MNIRQIRGWMYNIIMSGQCGVTNAFMNGVHEFIAFTCQTEASCSGKIRCPCLDVEISSI